MASQEWKKSKRKTKNKMVQRPPTVAKGNLVQDRKGLATMKKPSRGVLSAVERHTIGTRYVKENNSLSGFHGFTSENFSGNRERFLSDIKYIKSIF